MPYANTEAMQKHLEEISRMVAENAHAALLMDGAGWHKAKELKIPENITIIILPAYSPELNPVENIWQFLRQNYLSNRVFKTWEDIRDACCIAWKNLITEPGRIKSITTRDWAFTGQ